MATAQEAQSHFRVVLLGDAGVGKTALLERFRNNRFRDDLQATAGVGCWRVQLMVLGREVRIDVWDTPGNERLRPTIAAEHYRADAVAVVYSVDNERSFEGTRPWLAAVQERAPAGVKLFLVAAKLDLRDVRQVSTAAGRDFALSEGMTFVEASAKTDENVQILFSSIAQRLEETSRLEHSARLGREEAERRAREEERWRRGGFLQRLVAACSIQ